MKIKNQLYMKQLNRFFENKIYENELDKKKRLEEEKKDY